MSILGWLFGWKDEPGGLADQARNLSREGYTQPITHGCRDTCGGEPYAHFAREQDTGYTRESIAAARELEINERVELLRQSEQPAPIVVEVRKPGGDWIPVTKDSVFSRR